jgi:CRISPR-associated protein Csd2
VNIAQRHDFVFLFDVTNGNPNGDPDAGDIPRLDPETNHGLVTDVCLKRKIRDYVSLVKGGERGFAIYMQEGSVLNEKHREAYRAVRPDNAKVATEKRLNPQSDGETRALQNFMNQNYFDVRTFGAVMSTGINCGQVRGPVQLAFAQSVEPVVPLQIAITRMAATSTEQKDKSGNGERGDERRENRTMGRKHILPYALFRVHGFVSASIAGRTGFSDEDLSLIWDSLINMFEHDRSAAKGEMSARGLFVFRHATSLGSAQAQSLFQTVSVTREVRGQSYRLVDERVKELAPARRFSDYGITSDSSKFPGSVQMLRLL